MKVFAGAAALSALVKLALAQGNLIIQTPASLVECQPALLSFSGGQPPYFISALPAGQVSAQPILNLPEQAQAGTYTWNVNLPAGTNISLQIRDGTGALNYGSPVVIQAGTDSSCIDQAAASSATAGGAAATASVSTTVAGSASAGAPVSSAAAGSSLVTTTGDATSATVTAASGTPTTTATGVVGSGASMNSTGNFTCSQGLLTYGISTASLGNVSLSDATAFFGDLTRSQPTATNVSGTEVMFMVGNISYSFNITMNMTDTSTGSLHQQFEFLGTEPVELGNTTLYDAFEDLQVYTNTTNQETEVQYFILACFSEQPAGLSILGSIIGAAISSWTESLSNMTTMAAPARRAVKLF